MKEFLEIFLPDGILEWFDVIDIEKTARNIKITLEEKNIVPEIPEEHRNKKIVSKGFKKIVIDDFPVRGRKCELIVLRRSWHIDGVEKLLKRDIKLAVDGTKLEKEFADFLKDIGGSRAGIHL